jgi:hypothetical protein
LCRIADRQQFGVGRGIARKDDVVATFAHDDTLAHDDGAVRLIAFAQRLVPQCAGTRKESRLCLLLRLD